MQLIEPSTPATGVFRFRHSLTRDAIVSDLLPPDLASRSASAAAAIEDAHPGLPGIWCEQAAELHKAAGHPVRAASLLLEAGRRALHRGALRQRGRDACRTPGRLLAATEPGRRADAGHRDRRDARRGAGAGRRPRAARAAGRAADRHARLGRCRSPAGGHAQDQDRPGRVRGRPAERPQAQLAAARTIADELDDTALASQVDAAAARCALDSSDLDRAEELAHRSLATAEQAGMRGWAADVAFESLEVLGRRERVRDMTAARSAFQRAYQMAGGQDFAIRRIRALHELGTIDMLEDGHYRPADARPGNWPTGRRDLHRHGGRPAAGERLEPRVRPGPRGGRGPPVRGVGEPDQRAQARGAGGERAGADQRHQAGPGRRPRRPPRGPRRSCRAIRSPVHDLGPGQGDRVAVR